MGKNLFKKSKKAKKAEVTIDGSIEKLRTAERNIKNLINQHDEKKQDAEYQAEMAYMAGDKRQYDRYLAEFGNRQKMLEIQEKLYAEIGSTLDLLRLSSSFKTIEDVAKVLGGVQGELGFDTKELDHALATMGKLKENVKDSVEKLRISEGDSLLMTEKEKIDLDNKMRAKFEAKRKTEIIEEKTKLDSIIKQGTEEKNEGF